jgi:hypothetical protein
LSAVNLLPSQLAPGVCAAVSWLPLYSTGRFPVMVKAGAALPAE